MAGASTWLQIQKDCQTIIKAAAFPNLPSANVIVQKMSSIKEGINISLPCILVSPYGDPEQEPMDFEAGASNIYRVEVCVITAGNLDLSPDDEQQGWLEQARRVILRNGADWRVTLPNVPSVWDMQEETGETFDRSKLSSQYSYQSLVIRFHCNERNN